MDSVRFVSKYICTCKVYLSDLISAKQNLKIFILRIYSRSLIVITITSLQNPLIYAVNFRSARPLKEEIFWNKIFRLKSKSRHTCTEKVNTEKFYTFSRKSYISITFFTSYFEYLIVIIHISHMIIFYYGHKWMQDFIFVCQYVLLWLPHEVVTLYSFTYWNLINILKQPLCTYTKVSWLGCIFLIPVFIYHLNRSVLVVSFW